MSVDGVEILTSEVDLTQIADEFQQPRLTAAHRAGHRWTCVDLNIVTGMNHQAACRDFTIGQERVGRDLKHTSDVQSMFRPCRVRNVPVSAASRHLPVDCEAAGIDTQCTGYRYGALRQHRTSQNIPQSARHPKIGLCNQTVRGDIHRTIHNNGCAKAGSAGCVQSHAAYSHRSIAAGRETSRRNIRAAGHYQIVIQSHRASNSPASAACIDRVGGSQTVCRDVHCPGNRYRRTKRRGTADINRQ